VNAVDLRNPARRRAPASPVLGVLASLLLVTVLAACGAGPRPIPTATATASTAGRVPAGAQPTQPASASPSGGAKRYSTAPAMQIDPNKEYTATIKTNFGDIKVQLDAKNAPVTVNNFVFLARDGFYNGVIFHRIIKGFMIQGGDPTGTGRGGPGYQFADEPVKGSYEIGSIAMANSGPNTNGSQFFICQGPQCTGLPKSYNLFGKVVEGLDVVNKIADVPTTGPERSQPTQEVKITTIEISEK
jgi:cyclophilin family peptidyl-prolyl cis-trans isomerase